jgi:uroporphyrinogen III methyltransferase/synthase
MRVLNTRPRHQLAEFTNMLKAQGLEVIECPVLEIVPASKIEESLKEFIDIIKDGDWIFFTSQNAVRIAFEELDKMNQFGRLKKNQIAVIGENTAAKIHNYQLKPTFISSGKDALEMAEEFIKLYSPDVASKSPTIYFLRGESAQDELTIKLRQAQFRVSEIVVYQSQPKLVSDSDLKKITDLILQNKLNLIFLTSSLTAKALVELFPENNSLLKIPVAVIGDRTALTAKTLGFQTIMTAPHPTLEDLAKIASGWLNDQGLS